ncbi:MAG: putative hydrolase or acyltransferase of alpha/beta superfamily [Acidimicrobiales bacterium]|nr:putative hydrolase or acyltransferase of alpha/beta superfamily [Acidimicrobiales bacterium]
MNKKPLILGAGVVSIAAAAAGAYRATHPHEARTPTPPAGGRGRRRPVADDLLELPDDVVHREVPTPDGGVVHLVERGEGRPIVLLHGITLRSDVWSPQLHQLADRYRVIAVDLRGHGTSRAGTAGYGMARLARDLRTVLEALDLHHAIVVGHSMGGMTAMQFCGDHPEVLAERVDGMVFVATRAHQVFPPYVRRAVQELATLGQARIEDGRGLPSRASGGERLTRLAFGDRPSRRAVELVAEMGRSMDPAAFVSSAQGLLEHDARDALRGTRTPSLVVVGTRDVLTPVPAARHLAHLLPNSELVVLPRAGHQLMQERPDELAELIDGFVAKIEGDQPSVAQAVAEEPGPVRPTQVEPGDPAGSDGALDAADHGADAAEHVDAGVDADETVGR